MCSPSASSPAPLTPSQRVLRALRCCLLACLKAGLLPRAQHPQSGSHQTTSSPSPSGQYPLPTPSLCRNPHPPSFLFTWKVPTNPSVPLGVPCLGGLYPSGLAAHRGRLPQSRPHTALPASLPAAPGGRSLPKGRAPHCQCLGQSLGLSRSWVFQDSCMLSQV